MCSMDQTIEITYELTRSGWTQTYEMRIHILTRLTQALLYKHQSLRSNSAENNLVKIVTLLQNILVRGSTNI
jgi:hypothetical protein